MKGCLCEEPTGPRFARPEDKLRDEAIFPGRGCISRSHAADGALIGTHAQ